MSNAHRSAFQSAAAVLRATVQERRALRLTPVAPPPPRDSSPDAGMPEPEHSALAAAADDGDALPPPSARSEAWPRGA